MDSEKERNPSDNLLHARQNRALLAVIIVLLVVIIWLLIKPPIPPLPGLHLHGIHHKPEGPEKERTITGLIVAYKNNPHLDVNAVQIKTQNAGIITIDFRPHTAKTVMQLGSVGELVTVGYSLHPNDEVVGYQLMVIKNNKTGVSQVLKDLPPPPDIPNHIAENFKLDNPVLITDQYGGIVALRNGSLLFHFKPGLVDDIAPLIKESHQFNLMAVRRDDDLGFININHDKVYIVISITMDNKTFLVR